MTWRSIEEQGVDWPTDTTTIDEWAESVCCGPKHFNDETLIQAVRLYIELYDKNKEPYILEGLIEFDDELIDRGLLLEKVSEDICDYIWRTRDGGEYTNG